MGYAVKLQKGGSFIDKVLSIYTQNTYSGYLGTFSFMLKEDMKLDIYQRWNNNGWQDATYYMKIADATGTTDIYLAPTSNPRASCNLPKDKQLYLFTNTFGNTYQRWYLLTFYK